LNIIPQLYSELTVGKPDFIDLAERCELLTQILLDCRTPEQTRPVCRCLSAYLAALSVSLNDTMSELRVLELTTSGPVDAGQNNFICDSETQCEYCRSVTQSLLKEDEANNAETLSGLLHDLVCLMSADLKAPRFTAA
jgi:hypothetical protein